jgi:hypothetical protein
MAQTSILVLPWDAYLAHNPRAQVVAFPGAARLDAEALLVVGPHTELIELTHRTAVENNEAVADVRLAFTSLAYEWDFAPTPTMRQSTRMLFRRAVPVIRNISGKDPYTLLAIASMTRLLKWAEKAAQKAQDSHGCTQAALGILQASLPDLIAQMHACALTPPPRVGDTPLCVAGQTITTKMEAYFTHAPAGRYMGWRDLCDSVQCAAYIVAIPSLEDQVWEAPNGESLNRRDYYLDGVYDPESLMVLL